MTPNVRENPAANRNRMNAYETPFSVVIRNVLTRPPSVATSTSSTVRQCAGVLGHPRRACIHLPRAALSPASMDSIPKRPDRRHIASSPRDRRRARRSRGSAATGTTRCQNDIPISRFGKRGLRSGSRSADGRTRNRPKCRWHEHASGEACSVICALHARSSGVGRGSDGAGPSANHQALSTRRSGCPRRPACRRAVALDSRKSSIWPQERSATAPIWSRGSP